MIVKLIWQTPAGDRESVEIVQASYSIGRGESADIRIPDENASRLHARLRFDAQTAALFIEDSDSRNGVYVNGQRIEGETQVQADDTVLVGATTLTLALDMDALQEATAESELDPQRTRAMSLADINALIDEGQGGAEAEAYTHELDVDATMAIDAADIDATELFEAPAVQSAAPTYKLLVVSGEPYGLEFPLGVTPLSIGRSADCGIVLQAGAVSGHHAQVRLDGERVLLSDLGSKNGTHVSKAPISEETEIAIGTIFTVGGTDFNLLGGETFVSGERHPFGKLGNKKLLVLAGVALLLVVLAGGKHFLGREAAPPQAVPPSPAPQATAAETPGGLEPLQPLAQSASLTTGQAAPALTADEDEHRAPHGAAVQEGREDRTLAILRETADAFMDNRLWGEAIDKLKTLQTRDPQMEGVDALLQQAEFERANQQRFEEGLGHAARKQFAAAKTAFGAIPENSVYHDEALLELQSADKAARELAQAKRAKAAKPTVVAPKPKPATKPPSPPSAEKLARRQLDAAKRAYVGGDIPTAIAEAAAVGSGKLGDTHRFKRDAKLLAQQLQAARTGFVQGEKYFKADDVPAALKAWASVLAIDSKIAGSSESAYSRRIAAYMADHFYATAREAYNAKDWAAARGNALKAVKARPDHPGGRSLLGQLNGQAKTLYEEGYILEDLNPAEAAERWRQVLQVGSPDNEYYRKAREKLAKYGG
jgi:pSer/pThr/pTyr-binding forkhead associated (FHA) protein